MSTQTKKPHTEKNIREVAIERIQPNPYQPRREFDQDALQELARSIKQYGILQPLTVTKSDRKLEDGRAIFELVAGERRLRASKLAGLTRVPCVVRVGDDDKARFELAIIENVQREDLNAIDRATAFQRLVDEFGMTHTQIGKQLGKSRVYVSNSLRLLSLPKHIREAVVDKKISEGHTRPLLMLEDKPEQQMTLFKEIMYKKMSVRESEKVARKMAQDRVRKAKHKIDPAVASMEQQFSETLGTRVHIEKGEVGGKLVIDYFTNEDLDYFLKMLKNGSDGSASAQKLLQKFEQNQSINTASDLGFVTEEKPQAPQSTPAVKFDDFIALTEGNDSNEVATKKEEEQTQTQTITGMGIASIKNEEGYEVWKLHKGATIVTTEEKQKGAPEEKPDIFEFLAQKDHKEQIEHQPAGIENESLIARARKQLEELKKQQEQFIQTEKQEIEIPPFVHPHAGPPAIDLDSIDTTGHEAAHDNSFAIKSASGEVLRESPILDLNANIIDKTDQETMQLVSDIAVQYSDAVSDQAEVAAQQPKQQGESLNSLLGKIENLREEEQGMGFVASNQGKEHSVHQKQNNVFEEVAAHTPENNHMRTIFHAAEKDSDDNAINTPIKTTLHNQQPQDTQQYQRQFTDEQVEIIAKKYEGTQLAKLFDIKSLLKEQVIKKDNNNQA